jgi:hypothetical protein
MDTRRGQGGTRMGPLSTLTLPVRGQAGVPAQASAVVLNVTSTEASALSFLTVWPSGTARPFASNLNPVPNKNVPNQVVAKIGANGAVDLFNAAGSVHVVVDVAGWYDDGSPGTNGARFFGLEPRRVYDTRAANSPSLGPGETRAVPLAGAGTGVPTNAVAVAANLTVVAPSAPGYLTLFPPGAPQPEASVINFDRLETVANLGTVTLNGTGATNVFNPAGQTHVVFDVAGWFG